MSNHANQVAKRTIAALTKERAASEFTHTATRKTNRTNEHHRRYEFTTSLPGDALSGQHLAAIECPRLPPEQNRELENSQALAKGAHWQLNVAHGRATNEAGKASKPTLSESRPSKNTPVVDGQQMRVFLGVNDCDVLQLDVQVLNTKTTRRCLAFAREART